MGDDTAGGGEVPWYEGLSSPPDQPAAPVPPPSGDAPTTPFPTPSNPPLGGHAPTPGAVPGPQGAPAHHGGPPQYVAPMGPAGDTGAAPGSGDDSSGAKKGLLIGAAVVVVLFAVLGAGFIAMRLLSGGGAESPEAAVQTVVDAVNQQDVILAASVINPDELPMITELASRISEARDRLGAGSDGPVKGTSVTLDDVDTDVDELTDDVARITIDSADLSGSLDANAEDAPAAVRDIVTAFDPGHYDDEDASGEVEGTLGEFALIAVRDGGGWYLSPAMSALDTALLYSYDSESYEGDFDEAIESGFFSSGSDSPEEAVEELADALADGNPEDVAEMLPSDVGAAVAVYADWLFETVLPPGYNEDGWDVKDLKLEVEGGPGGTKKVLISDLKMSNDYDETLRINGLEVDDNDGPWSELTSNRGREVPYFRLISEAIGDNLYLLTREVDDGWKVDPVATALDISSQIMEKVDPDVLAGVTASTDGDPDASLAIGEVVEVELDEYGHAVLEAPTEDGKLYALTVQTDSTESPGYTYGTMRVNDDVFTRNRIRSYDTEVHEPYLFRAEGPTRIGLGMLMEDPGGIEMGVYEVPVTTHEFGKSINGELKSPVEVHTVDGVVGENLRTDCSGEVQFGYVWTEDVELSYDDECVEGDFAYEERWEADLIADRRIVLVAHGDVGDEYELLVEEAVAGFENGEREISVSVGDSTYVSFSKPEGYWYIDVDWYSGADIDGYVEVDGETYDSDDSSYGSSFTLDLPYDAADGEVELTQYSSGSSSTSFGSDSDSSMVTLRLVEE